jgi:hypothetical protein
MCSRIRKYMNELKCGCQLRAECEAKYSPYPLIQIKMNNHFDFGLSRVGIKNLIPHA